MTLLIFNKEYINSFATLGLNCIKCDFKNKTKTIVRRELTLTVYGNLRNKHKFIGYDCTGMLTTNAQ